MFWQSLGSKASSFVTVTPLHSATHLLGCCFPSEPHTGESMSGQAHALRLWVRERPALAVVSSCSASNTKMAPLAVYLRIAVGMSLLLKNVGSE